jgi:uncharacterized protein YceH (UPF0502 family)
MTTLPNGLAYTTPPQPTSPADVDARIAALEATIAKLTARLRRLEAVWMETHGDIA